MTSNVERGGRKIRLRPGVARSSGRFRDLHVIPGKVSACLHIAYDRRDRGIGHRFHPVPNQDIIQQHRIPMGNADATGLVRKLNNVGMGRSDPDSPSHTTRSYTATSWTIDRRIKRAGGCMPYAPKATAGRQAYVWFLFAIEHRKAIRRSCHYSPYAIIDRGTGRAG